MIFPESDAVSIKPVIALIATVFFSQGAWADSTLEHRFVAGAAPEPIREEAGLRSPEELETFFDGIMGAHLQAQHVAGATLAVVKDGKLFFAKGYGFADVDRRVPVVADQTLFRPGSTSKLFTWTAVMQLVGQGKLDLDADINGYLKDFQIPQTFAQPVTLRNLMTHTGGFEDGSLGYLFARTAADSPPLAQALKDHLPARIWSPTTDFTDGTGSAYSNWATALAGHIVATVSGMPYDDYIERNIFEPLGMTRSSFREPLAAGLAEHVSVGYQFKDGKWLAHDYEYIHQFGPAGSLASTATDMARFMIAHLQDGALGERRILTPETAQLMHRRQLSPNPYIAGAALGFYETWINGRRVIGHGGDTICFHSDLNLLPDENIGLFVSYNTSATLPFSARSDLMKLFMNRYFPAKLPQISPPADFEQRAARYAGSYRFTRKSYTSNEKMFSLLGDIHVTPTRENALSVTTMALPVASLWIEVAPNVFRQRDSDEMIAFAEDGQGNVTDLLGLPFAFVSARKIGWYESLPWHAFIAGFGVLCFIVSIVSALRHWREDRRASAPARVARRLAALAGVIYLVFLVLLAATFTQGLEELIYGWPAVFKIALALPLASIPIVAGMLYLAARAWRERWWTLYGRLQYSAIALACSLFLWSLNFVNLVGYKFG